MTNLTAEQWIKVDERLPDARKWVLVVEDDRENPQDEFWTNHFKRPLQRVSHAQLSHVDQEGYPYFDGGIVGNGPICIKRNVTHWMPYPDAPK